MATVVSVVSGKGGSGKSLLTAVLGQALAREGSNVLLVDVDIFVRGLTVLLYSFRRPKGRNGTVTVSDLLGVFAEQSQARGPVDSSPSNYMIERFHECDVLPAVDNIGAPLDYDDASLGDEEFCRAAIRGILDSVGERYHYIFLDNRAGMDSLVAAACANAHIILAVAEDDPIGRQTNVNLVRFLQHRKNIRVVYSVVNKGRGLQSYPEIRDRARQQRHEFSMLGLVPFDIEVMESFGSDRFWTTVTETLYFRSVLDVWNELGKTESVTELSEKRYRFPPRLFMRPKEGRYSLIERMLRVYSVSLIVGGVAMWTYGRFRLIETRADLYDIGAITAIAVGALALVLSTSGVLLRRRDARRPEELN